MHDVFLVVVQHESGHAAQRVGNAALLLGPDRGAAGAAADLAAAQEVDASADAVGGVEEVDGVEANRAPVLGCGREVRRHAQPAGVALQRGERVHEAPLLHHLPQLARAPVQPALVLVVQRGQVVLAHAHLLAARPASPAGEGKGGTAGAAAVRAAVRAGRVAAGANKARHALQAGALLCRTHTPPAAAAPPPAPAPGAPAAQALDARLGLGLQVDEAAGGEGGVVGELHGEPGVVDRQLQVPKVPRLVHGAHKDHAVREDGALQHAQRLGAQPRPAVLRGRGGGGCNACSQLPSSCSAPARLAGAAAARRTAPPISATRSRRPPAPAPAGSRPRGTPPAGLRPAVRPSPSRPLSPSPCA